MKRIAIVLIVAAVAAKALLAAYDFGRFTAAYQCHEAGGDALAGNWADQAERGQPEGL